MKIPIDPNLSSLCEQCVALCCRYFAFAIETPETKRDFEDIRWYMLHGDTIVFVEDDEWFIQINRKCKALLPDNRCGIYENRPEICREYTTEECDWHGEEYDYEHLFTEPEQIQVFAKEYLANKRKRKTKAKQSSSKSSSKSKSSEGSSSSSKRRSGSKKKRAGRARPGLPLKLLKTA